MELGFTPQEVSDVRIVFDVFDVPGRGWIPLDDLRKALRLLGFKISRERVQQVAAEVQGKALMRGQTDFPAFLHTVSKLQGSSYDKYGEIMQVSHCRYCIDYWVPLNVYNKYLLVVLLIKSTTNFFGAQIERRKIHEPQLAPI